MIHPPCPLGVNGRAGGGSANSPCRAGKYGKRNVLLLIAVASTLSIALSASADEDSGFTLSASGMYSQPGDVNIQIAPLSFDVGLKDDFGFAVGIGYRMGELMGFEVEYLSFTPAFESLESFARSLDIDPENIELPAGGLGNLEVRAVMANAYYLFPGDSWGAYLGAGLGPARLSGSTTEGSETGVGWQFAAGVTYSVIDNMEVRAEQDLEDGDTLAVDVTNSNSNFEFGALVRF